MRKVPVIFIIFLVFYETLNKAYFLKTELILFFLLFVLSITVLVT